MVRRVSLFFAAGAFGGLLNVAAIWLLNKQGMPVPTASLALLYKQVAWGGLWGLAFFLPIFQGNWWARGFVIGLLPALVVLLYFLPQRGAGLFGLESGPLVPVMVIFLNSVVWGMGAALWIKATGAGNGR